MFKVYVCNKKARLRKEEIVKQNHPKFRATRCSNIQIMDLYQMVTQNMFRSHQGKRYSRRKRSDL